MKVGYARVSRKGQKLGLQRVALRRAGCSEIFVEKRSGVRTDLPARRSAMSKVRRGDALVIWKVDRLGRDLLDLLLVHRDLERKGARILSIVEGIDTATPVGKLQYQMSGAFAEYEHNTLIVRTKAGMQAARAEGHRAGRKRQMTDKKVARAKALKAKKVSLEAIAAKLKVGKTTVWRAVSNRRAAE